MNNTKSNALPSYLGRIFKIERDDNNKFIRSGNFTYPPLLSDLVDKLPSTVLLSTEIMGATQETKKLNASLDFGAILDQALKNADLPSSILNDEGLLPEIQNIFLAYSKSSLESASSFGSFQYVSLSYSAIDEITHAISSPDFFRQPIEPDDVAGDLPARSSQDRPKTFSFDGVENSDMVRYLSELKNYLDSHSENEYGLIVGVNLINTSSGLSSRCEGRQGYLGNERSSLNQTVQCADLKQKLDDLLSQKASNSEAQSLILNSSLSEQIVVAYMEHRKASYKSLRIDGHSSVWAIHFIQLPAHESIM